jgi:hypothetical protein
MGERRVHRWPDARGGINRRKEVCRELPAAQSAGYSDGPLSPCSEELGAGAEPNAVLGRGCRSASLGGVLHFCRLPNVRGDPRSAYRDRWRCSPAGKVWRASFFTSAFFGIPEVFVTEDLATNGSRVAPVRARRKSGSSVRPCRRGHCTPARHEWAVRGS